jgi:hypothetical protein
MLALGLVQGDQWRPDDGAPDEPGDAPRAWTWRLPWRPLAWFAAWAWLMALVPVVNDALGALAGYGVLMLAIVLAGWRLNRVFARGYWYGMRDYKS